jgi:hypothetical protein
MPPPPQQQRKKRKRSKEKNTQPFPTHIVSIPIAQQLLCGTPERAKQIFKKETTATMNKIMAACTEFHKIPHYQFHNTDIIGKPPPPPPKTTTAATQHPWGYLTFGIVKNSTKNLAWKKCIVSAIHHRNTLSPEDALVCHAKNVPWDELQEIDL